MLTTWPSCVLFLCFCQFLKWCFGSGMVLDLSIPDLCLPLYDDENWHDACWLFILHIHLILFLSKKSRYMYKLASVAGGTI